MHKYLHLNSYIFSWKILSEVIRGSSLQNTSAISEKTEMRKALEVASHWKRVLYSIVSAMVPTSALLRFGLYDAKGRNPHPLCNDLPESALSSEAVISSHFSSRNEVGVNIKKVRFWLIMLFLKLKTVTYTRSLSVLIIRR